jgi:hypothetical protein
MLKLYAICMTLVIVIILLSSLDSKGRKYVDCKKGKSYYTCKVNY